MSSGIYTMKATISSSHRYKTLGVPNTYSAIPTKCLSLILIVRWVTTLSFIRCVFILLLSQMLSINDDGRHPWYNFCALDCWLTGRAIDPAPEAWFITKFISFAQVLSGPVYLNSAESWPKIPIIHSFNDENMKVL